MSVSHSARTDCAEHSAAHEAVKRRTLPQIIAVGPTRTGTTWLDEVLRGHVGLPKDVKEPNFFRARYERGVDWYAAHFRDCPADLPIMEIGPTYFPSEDARRRIAEHIPNCRIICTLRDPVERLYSSYRLMIKAANWTGSFEENIRRRPEALDGSRYAHHLKKWIERFGRENVLVVRYEDLPADPQRYLDRICDFIGIARVKLNGEGAAKVNAAERAPWNPKVARAGAKIADWLESRRLYQPVNLWRASPLWELFFGLGAPFPPLDAKVADEIRSQLVPDIAELEKLLGWELSWWMKPPEKRIPTIRSNSQLADNPQISQCSGSTRPPCQTSTGERPLFFPSHGRPLYGVFHPAAKPGRDAVAIFCHSVGLEHMTSSRLETLGAREIASRGVPVLRYHARGHGDSAGDYQDVTLGSLVEDAMAAADYARELTGARKIIWIATRFGSLVAAEAIAHRDDATALAMWEPVHRGRHFFRENLRNLLFSEVAQGQRPTTNVDQLLKGLEHEGRVELFGTYLHYPLYRSSLEADLLRAIGRWSGPTLLVQIQKRQRLSSDNEKLKAVIEDRTEQSKVRVLFIAEEPGWSMFPHPPYFNEEIMRRTGDWIDGLA